MNYAALLSDPGAMVSVGFLVKVEENTQEVHSEAMPAVTPGGCLFRAEVFSYFEGFDSDVTVVADHKWFMHARLKGIKFVSHQGIILKKYIHGQNISVVRRQQYRNELMALFKGGRS
jgi:hypothetical protein